MAGPGVPPACALPDDRLLADCLVEGFRAGGPGGQHVNRTDSAVRLTHRPSGVTATCQEHRERGRNAAEALRRLRLRLAIAQRGDARPALLAPHRRGRSLPAGPASAAYPLIVATCLDALAAAKGSLPAAAQALGISSSQLVKALSADKEVRLAADRLRAGFGCSPLR